MYHWILSHPDLAPHLNQARDSRAEALSAGSYQAIKATGAALDALVAGVTRLAGGYRAWRSRQAAIASLRRLDNRLLRDIGIDRSEIVSVVLAVEAQQEAAESRTTEAPSVAAYDRSRILRLPERASENDNRGPALPRAACG